MNCEQYLIRSQGRLDVTAFAHSFETTYGNKHVRVVQGTDKDGKKFGGSEFTTVGGEYACISATPATRASRRPII